jgi:hypothetical protein
MCLLPEVNHSRQALAADLRPVVRSSHVRLNYDPSAPFADSITADGRCPSRDSNSVATLAGYAAADYNLDSLQFVTYRTFMVDYASSQILSTGTFF